jgi:lipid-binding SYLF domain-containing protein
VDIVSHNNIRRYCNAPFALTLGSEIRKASYTVYNFITSDFFGDKNIPLRMVSEAKGLAFLTVLKGGFVAAPRIGTGLVIARLPSGEWSAPSAIGTMGVSWGALAGLDVTDYMIVLNSHEAVAAFKGCCQLSIGVGLEFAAGALGRWVVKVSRIHLESAVKMIDDLIHDKFLISICA